MHLFAGAGGGLLADLILGHQPVVAVEWDAYCCQVLRERTADGWFPGLRVWEGDVRMFDPSEYAGSVDCIHAGFPCQDISVAGKQAGVGEETRSGLYREVLRIAGVVRPRYLFLENVAAIVSNGLETVLTDLAALGYDSEWLCLRASDCGANHHRDRWWLLAHTKGIGYGEGRETGNIPETDGRQDGELPSIVAISSCCNDVADSAKLHRDGGNDHAGISMEHGSLPESGNGCWKADVADPCSAQRQGMRGTFGSGQEHADAGFCGWWQVESDVGRVANGIPHRVHRLKALGNAQVPLQAAVAWKLLGGE